MKSLLTPATEAIFLFFCHLVAFHSNCKKMKQCVFEAPLTRSPPRSKMRRCFKQGNERALNYHEKLQQVLYWTQIQSMLSGSWKTDYSDWTVCLRHGNVWRFIHCHQGPSPSARETCSSKCTFIWPSNRTGGSWSCKRDVYAS